MREPVVGRDDPCVVDLRRRPPIARRDNDPFCSTECCQAFHDVKHTGDDPRERINARKDD